MLDEVSFFFCFLWISMYNFMLLFQYYVWRMLWYIIYYDNYGLDFEIKSRFLIKCFVLYQLLCLWCLFKVIK